MTFFNKALIPLGIIPITCEELFKAIDEKKLTDEAEKEAEYQVEA